MADLVSHPDEVRVVSQRFGKGATDIERHLELDGYKAVRKALEQIVLEPAAARPSIAVLPFANMSGDPDNE